MPTGPKSPIGAILFVLLLIIGVNWAADSARGGALVVAYLLTSAGLVFFFGAVGKLTSGVWNGAVIDNRNRVSLSKVQATAWTILILAAFTVAVGARLQHGLGDNAIAVGIPNSLLAVMGIAATSLVATPALLSLKDKGPAISDPVAAAAAAANPNDPTNPNAVHAKAAISDANWADVFRGDDNANAASVDLSKVQQFLITAGLLIFYAIQLGTWLKGLGLAACTPGPKGDCGAIMPDFGQNMAWLLGISHAGYLGYKAVPHAPGK